MKYYLLIFGFLISVTMLVAVGINALVINERLITSFDENEKHFEAIANASTEVSSYVKRAEGHLMLYLTLHRQSDKEKYPKRIASLYQQIVILDQKLTTPETRKILQEIKDNAREVLSIGNSLITHHDKAIKQTGAFEIETHKEAIFKLHENFSAARKLGVELSAVLIKSENDLKQEIFHRALRLRFYMYLNILLAAAFIVCSGIVLGKMISALRKEVAVRKESEEALYTERDKLKDALNKVKLLRGLLPICAICKKIRDDKGYWNQIELYISNHSEAEFSHSICPACAAEQYPDINTHEDQE